jgi:protein TonB
MALSISIVFHAVVLSIHFKLPDALRGITPSQLDVVLVNSKTRARPVRADVLAQANLDGGGDTELDRRAKSPLPVLQPSERGADLKQATPGTGNGSTPAAATFADAVAQGNRFG